MKKDNGFYQFRHNHPEYKHLTIEEQEAIYESRRRKSGKLQKDVAKEYGISETTIRIYKSKYKELADKTPEEIAKFIKQVQAKREGLRDACRRLGYPEVQFYDRVHDYIRKNPSDTKTYDDFILEFASLYKPREKESIPQLCKEYKVSTSAVQNYIYAHKHDLLGLSNREIVESFIKHKKAKETTKSFADYCKDYKIVYWSALDYRRRHKELSHLSDKEFVKYYKQLRENNHGLHSRKQLKCWCKQLDIPFDRAVGYQKFSGASDIEVIQYYRPDVKVNLFGEIVDV